MHVDSLEKLESEFRDWRRKKKHVRERVPVDLLARAHRAAAVHGVQAVAKATQIDGSRLGEGMKGGVKGSDGPARDSGEAAAGDQPKKVPATKAKATVPAAPSAGKPARAPVPSYSRLELGPETAARPVVEVETPAGVKLRVFQVTAETVALLTTLSGSGWAP